MKKLSLLVCSCLVGTLAYGQADAKLAIIPEPVKITEHPGTYTLPKTLTIQAAPQAEMTPILDLIKNKFSTATGKVIKVKPVAADAAIKLVLNKTMDNVIGKEGYYLSAKAKGVTIRANTPAGLYYGVQTLLQLLPNEIEGKVIANVKWTVPIVDITDYPRFEWRGLMFDVSRHFFTKKEVMSYIDNMAKYKLNLFHWHLTDDEGWRVEIKSYPKLTTVGAYNVKREGSFGDFTPPKPNEPRNYGGFYTQDDIREVIKYANARFVNIMPEIDVPGHSLAAVAAYPELSATAGADKYVVRSGEKIMDWSKPGHPAMVDNTLNPAGEFTYTFLDKVVGEIAELFPFPYIHMGGDECAKNFWEQSDQVKALMAKENLKTQEEVQSYFEKRLEKIVESKGKKFMGWDEILEGGIGPNAALMSWRGVKGGIEAAKLGHEVVMSPTTFVYLDYMQSDRVMEPHVYASLRLSKTYEFDPVPAGVDAKMIKGGQANLWTEQVYNIRQAEYMTWPRGFAVAESVWSPASKKNFNTFFTKVEKHFDRFNQAEVKYAPSAYDPDFKPGRNVDSTLNVTLTNEVQGLDTYYSFDNSYPDCFYPKYTGVLNIPIDATQMKVITYRGKKPVGRMISMPIDELKSRLGK
ncbi:MULTISPECIES: family 20 glycosylhydrolase [unclassified Mucilaginibacter]|uniref:beta-N-acetylhexosaminidase n=1 Tax=unclassified Mucilaginibacter TaxID=2617802 RepID=UPI002AC8EB04|nr:MULTISPECIES: family 20 glycosylhydrolase [unclassified Mucilaginibacter]MEB0260899.1 family 20 glycosylhydrolase [Mucilaginibacter sp. 10I4]MEB0279866.1 family 20 glycosylhydrolase [Mucilaginibacter sp. 10B2]MEB0302455.1 family 20 glycosylhydrolase [Mucilaginibacter sp. 5C4]WPX24163.1 family 20 glycosylhydrolase [Mucilaginibacter sp. 5C4]